jgi:hypothetical protein
MNLKYLVLSLLLVSVLATTVITQPNQSRVMPSNFKSDGCSLFPDGNYRNCCEEHDKDYYFGGTSAERKSSDKRLYKCVRATRGWQNKFVAPIIWLGVRSLGVSFLPTPFRWGFGIAKPESIKK